MKRLVVLAWLLVGCPVPQPVPVPPGPQPVADAARRADAPPPSDNFTGKIFDCHTSVVAVERESATGDVNYCLTGSSSAAVNACVTLKLGQYNSATVACLIRDLGADANAAFLIDKTDQGAQVRAAGARNWLIEHQVGYR
jgi:hypothetical protein